MRIVAGRLGGRQFDSPHGQRTHPMSENVRGALFNVLGDIHGLTVLDAFAGSGALSFEAISRGAASALAIESDRQAQRVSELNIKTLGIEEEVKLIKASVSAWLSTSDDLFDLVLCDPPYGNLQPKLLAHLAARTKTGAIIVYSLPPKVNFRLEPSNYSLLTTKSYGDAQLVFYRRIK